MTVSHNVDMVKTGEFGLTDKFIYPPDEDGSDSANSGDENEGGQYIYIFLLFELSFNDCRSWIKAWAEGGYNLGPYFPASHNIALQEHSKGNNCARSGTIKTFSVHFNTNLKVKLV